MFPDNNIFPPSKGSHIFGNTKPWHIMHFLFPFFIYFIYISPCSPFLEFSFWTMNLCMLNCSLPSSDITNMHILVAESSFLYYMSLLFFCLDGAVFVSWLSKIEHNKTVNNTRFSSCSLNVFSPLIYFWNINTWHSHLHWNLFFIFFLCYLLSHCKVFTERTNYHFQLYLSVSF